MRICVGNVKGGTGKTSTAVHLALGLSRSGRTLLIDADPEQDGSVEWAQLAEDWPASQCIVIKSGSRDLVKQIGPMLGDYEHAVFDTGPKNPIMLRQALSLVDELIIPVRPTSHELPELHKTFEIAAEVDATHPITATVLLVQVRGKRSRNARDARELLGVDDMPVMDSTVRLLQRYELARGTAPVDDLGDYEDVLTELLDGAGRVVA